MSLFRKLLIANRGEIAVRVARTARVLGIPTVAVYSEADRQSLHARSADEAVEIGPAEARQSYLKIDAILAAAQKTGADAVHPGYGFLSQNGDFADACRDAGLVFVGPPGDVHRQMGDKAGARRLMTAAGVPVVPGYDGDDQSDESLVAEASRIGFPLMLKPSRGGGGKGMRVVSRAQDVRSALESCRREAAAAFGDDRMVLERFVGRPRHVEVQVLADAHGQTVHLFERECSVQRRHQKVLEETPSPGLDQALREALCAAGVASARAAGYLNAGTVEFLLDPQGRFYFLEMNTRLQVEHPVTELVTGLDLVRLQLEVAAGKPLSFSQADLRSSGHALEARLYAEDPANDDLPSAGTVLCCALPEGPGLRVDTGISAGSVVPVHYDPMLAKLIAWGATREESIQRLEEALARCAVLGLTTNLDRLRSLLAHPEFRAGHLHTGFIEEHLSEVSPHPCAPKLAIAALLAALHVSRSGSGSGTASAGAGRTEADPFVTLGGWRLS